MRKNSVVFPWQLVSEDNSLKKKQTKQNLFQIPKLFLVIILKLSLNLGVCMSATTLSLLLRGGRESAYKHFKDIFSYIHFYRVWRSTGMFSFFPEDLLGMNILSIIGNLSELKN